MGLAESWAMHAAVSGCADPSQFIEGSQHPVGIHVQITKCVGHQCFVSMFWKYERYFTVLLIFSFLVRKMKNIF
jgi:hypothetical protein